MIIITSSLKTAEGIGAAEGKVRELLRGSGISAEDAEVLAKAITDSSIQGGEILKRALESAGNIASMKSAKQTAFEDQQVKMYENQKANQHMVDYMLDRAKDRELAYSQMRKVGLIDENGKAETYH